jgi:response regulator of citrate/malate metabolism
VSDSGTTDRLLEALRQSGRPLMIKEVAQKMGVSANTAGKYVDICEAHGIVKVTKYATARQVSLVEPATRR